MNGILATGFARFDNTGNNVYLSFDYNSTVVGENSGKSLFLFTEALNRNYFNTFYGYRSGQYSSIATNNIFIGYDAGRYVQICSNNILIGANYSDNSFKTLYDVLAIGYNNNPSYNSIYIGNSNSDSGYNNVLIGDNNNGQNVSDIVCIGNQNDLLNITNSILIGNKNITGTTQEADNVIVIGNNNLTNSTINYTDLLNSNPIIIGTNINDSQSCEFTINIGETYCKYDNYVDNELLYLGGKSKYKNDFISSTFGFQYNEINLIDSLYNLQQSNNYLESSNFKITPSSIYAKYGIFTDKISLGSFPSDTSELMSNYSITLYNSSNLTSNIRYIIPDYPDIESAFLSYEDGGNLVWKKINIKEYNTDKISQGTSNLYYNPVLVDARIDANYARLFQTNFELKMSQINTDNINLGSNNKFITNGIINSDLYVFGTLTVNRLQVLGVDLDKKMTLNEYIDDILQETSNTIFNTINEYDNRIEYLNNIIS